MKQGKLIFDRKIEVIEEGAFENLLTLKSISIPNTVKRIEQRAFSNCKSLTGTIRYKGYYNEWCGIELCEGWKENTNLMYVECKDGLYCMEPYITFTALEDDCSLGFYYDEISSDNLIEYSFDKENWYKLSDNVTIENGSNIYCRGLNPYGISMPYQKGISRYFVGTGKFNVSGDIMTLINYNKVIKDMPEPGNMMYLFGRNEEDYIDIVDASGLILSAKTLTDDCYANMFDSCSSMVYGPQIEAETLAPYCYYKMFYNCTSLVTTPELPATTLARECYAYMFYNCTSLAAAPELPTTTLAPYCYQYMFSDCTSLVTAPELPATTLAAHCYKYMFQGCTSLVTAPELPATTLTDRCYRMMFYGCKSLTTAPELPATTLANYCYSNMFNGCAGLTQAPELPANELSDNCYAYMFYNCTSLTTAPELPATTLADSCYQYMFNGCASLTTVPGILPATTLVNRCYQYMFAGCTLLTTSPELPATMLAPYCYQYMFDRCSSLTTVPEILPATTLADYCYRDMFRGCTSLTTAPELPATTLAPYCYQYMFSDCTSLVTAPELPATMLAPYCYQCMFEYCTSLVTAPDLPSITLSNNCYHGMFRSCKSLTTSPELPAAMLAPYCYQYMFSDCIKLNHIECLAMDISADSCTSNWVSGVASVGTFIKHPGMNNWSTGSSGIPSGWNIEMPYIIFTAQEDNSLIGLTKLSTNQTLEYSTSVSAWITFDTTTNISLNNGDKVYVRGILSADNSPSNYTQFKMSGLIAASGNCNAIWNYRDLNAPLKDYCGYYMFQDCTSLVTAPDLSATTLVECCYNSMFNGCTNLNYIECLSTDISATDCTTSWVDGVASVGTFIKHPDMTDWTRDVNGIPEGWNIEDAEMPYVIFTAQEDNSSIGLTKLSSYQTLEYRLYGSNWSNMNTSTNISLNSGDKVYVRGVLRRSNTSSNYTQFKMSGKIASSGNCNAIWNYQDLNTPLKVYCGYNMFRGCKSLTTAPELPATELDEGCYYGMFWDCTSLVTAPELPATELAPYCYSSMFYNCTSLVTALELLATTLSRGCCSYMFYNCTSLVTAPELPATELDSYCYQYMFYNCTSLTKSPEILPATMLSNGCYHGMFWDCTSLVTAPELPATTLAQSCYSYMFEGCSNLNKKLYYKSDFPLLNDDNFLNYFIGWDLYIDGVFVGTIEGNTNNYYY